ncbi:MAG: hypothetical protein ACRC2T_07080 [Thermoguttaceae bacterium]
MSTISSYISTTSSGRSTITENNKPVTNAVEAPRGSSCSTQDTLEISEQGMKIMLWNKQIKQAPNKDSFSINNTNLLTWGLGLRKESGSGMKSGFISNGLFLLGQAELKSLSNDVRDNWKKLDTKITELLEANDIKLSKDETLNFKVDQSGAIKVGDGVDKTKAAKIEKILNSDETLGKELILQHAKKSISNPGMTVSNHGPSDKVRAILLDNILTQEAGSSLSDLSFDMESSEFVSASGNGAAGALLEAEPDLLNELARLYTENDAEGKYAKSGVEFEVSYAYKNGTVIDQELAGKSALDKRANTAFRWVAMTSKAENQGKPGPVTVNFDKFGRRIGGATDTNMFSTALVSVFSEDALRLHQYEKGDAETGEHELSVTLDNGSVAYNVTSPQADTEVKKEIASIGQEIMDYIETQVGKMSDLMDVKLDANNKLIVNFSGGKEMADMLGNAFVKATADTSFQAKTWHLIETLQKLHTSNETIQISR